MDDLVLKVTPMMVLPDIQPVLLQYLALGFEAVDSGDPACVGLRAGTSHLILLGSALMEKDFRKSTVAPLVGATIPYIHVQSLSEAKARLDSGALLVEEALTGGGTIEAVVVQHGQFLILAQSQG